MSVWFKSRLNPWYIWIPSNPNLYSTKIIMKMRWQTIASNVSIRTISPTATPLPKAYDCVAVYIAGRRTSLVVYGWWPQPPTKNSPPFKFGLSNFPADTLSNNDVFISSKRRHFDVTASKWRRFDVITTLLLRQVFSGLLHPIVLIWLSFLPRRMPSCDFNRP